jgi:uncharacterized protein (TIGR00255 family)
VEIRSVNHRFLNVSLRLPDELASCESELRDLLRREFDRGHLSVSARWISSPGGSNGSGPGDHARARLVAARLRELQAALGVSGDISLELILRQPEMLGHTNGSQPVVWAEVEPLVSTAALGCREARAREGAVLARELRDRLDAIAREAERVRSLVPLRLASQRDRMRQAVSQLLDGRALDEQRLVTELAFLAERQDVTEELVRLDAHLAACQEALGQEMAVGKQLGFLAQELGREMNTVGSKANDVAMQHAVVAMKGELERFREQLENLA